MYPKIRAAPRSAARCSNRIEIIPSRRAALLWIGWLLALCCAIFLGVALPLPARLAICSWLLATCIPVLRSFILLRGSRAVRRLEWTEGESGEGSLTAFLGPALMASPAQLTNGCFRLGNQVLVLRLATGFGVRSVLVDSSVQEPEPFRRLCRRLETRPRRPPKGSGLPS
jgi:hypothetical protein